MTVHEMLYQVALLASGEYTRKEDESVIAIRLPGGRRQKIFGREDVLHGEPIGLLYTKVGVLREDIDPAELLAMNSQFRYARISLDEKKRIVLLVPFDRMKTSVKQCAPMLQEIAAVADDLEQRYFTTDEH